MKKWWLFIFFSLIIQLSQAQPCREVIAYFPSWKWYDRSQLVNPFTIDYSKYTAINYAFFQPNPDGSIMPFDPWADKNLLLGKIKTSAPPGYGKWRDFGTPQWHEAGTSLVEKAHEHGVKVLISIGGWTMSQHFSSIAASETKCRRFARDCAEMVRVYGVDGIDIDWEYPGYSAQNGSSTDQYTFPLLLKAVRDSLNSIENEMGRELWLTAAFGVSPNLMSKIQWNVVEPLLDYINLMTYDFYSSGHPYTNHNAPLFAPEKGLDGFDTHSVVHRLRDFYGVPPEKINVGLAFYGRSHKTKSKPGLHVASGMAPDFSTFPEDAGNPAFYNLFARKSLFQYQWDSLAQVPYLMGQKVKTFVSFEDENSISRKARYILDHNLAGAIIWDITGDYLESYPGSGFVERTPLADALAAVLCSQAIEDEIRVSAVPSQLPQRWSPLERKKHAPRLLPNLQLSKKERKALEKRLKKERKKRKEPVNRRYFDAS